MSFLFCPVFKNNAWLYLPRLVINEAPNIAWMRMEVGIDSQMVESVGDFSLVPCSKQQEPGSCSAMTKVGLLQTIMFIKKKPT